MLTYTGDVLLTPSFYFRITSAKVIPPSKASRDVYKCFPMRMGHDNSHSSRLPLGDCCFRRVLYFPSIIDFIITFCYMTFPACFLFNYYPSSTIALKLLIVISYFMAIFRFFSSISSILLILCSITVLIFLTSNLCLSAIIYSIRETA